MTHIPYIFTAIATARANEQAARVMYKSILKARPDVFGSSLHTHYGELYHTKECEPQPQPGDSHDVKARESAILSITLRLKADREALVTAILDLVESPTAHRRTAVKNALDDVEASIGEAVALGVQARHLKEYGKDFTAEDMATLVNDALKAELHARLNNNLSYADDIATALEDMRTDVRIALDEAQPRHGDVKAVMTAFTALDLLLEDI